MIEQIEKNEVSSKVSECLEDIIGILNKHRLSYEEIVLMFSNLSYTLGASMDGYKEKGPSIDELEKMYYTKPTAGIALMMTGMEASVWYNNLIKKS